MNGQRIVPPTADAADLPKHFDFVVVGGTPAGIAFALRSGREGASVLIVHHTRHLGGMLVNGLSVWDSRYERKRSPVYNELRADILDYYRTTYGADSRQFICALPGATGHSNGKFEARVAESLIAEKVAQEKRITVLLEHFPIAVERRGALMRSITFRHMKTAAAFRATASVFVECSYEADTFPLAGIPYRVGRESRVEHGEPHAGVIYMQPADTAPTEESSRLAARQARLGLRRFPEFQKMLPESTGEGDGNVQGINYRIILTDNPANRVAVEKPTRYDAEELAKLDFNSEIEAIPNDKICLNRPQLLGLQTAYVEGNWEVRHKIMDAHWQKAVALLWFKQNDPSVPETERARWMRYGLARDEFADNGNRPYEIYFREGRRLQGRYLLTQADTTLADGLHRPPLHADAIAFSEWYVDSHACTPRRANGSLEEGKVMLYQESFPGQIPYRALLPQGVDNMLVPVNMSCTHVAWNTVRLEATWMHVAEAAAYAALQALREGIPPASIDCAALQRTLAQRGVALAFFNDLEPAVGNETVMAAQYFSTRGFFPDFDAQLDAPLDTATAQAWVRAARLDAPADPTATARAVLAAAEGGQATPITRGAFAAICPGYDPAKPAELPILRREALIALWRAHLNRS